MPNQDYLSIESMGNNKTLHEKTKRLFYQEHLKNLRLRDEKSKGVERLEKVE